MSKPSRDKPPVLVSDRLRLRPITAKDWPGYVGLYGNEEAMALLGGAHTEKQCREGARNNERRWQEYGFASWLVDFIDENGSVVENVALLGFSTPHDDGAVPFGWLVSPRRWRQGISTEASELALGWFFSKFDHPVITETRPDNIGSRRTSEKLGFTLIKDEGDEYVCEITREQWLATRSATIQIEDVGLE